MRVLVLEHNLFWKVRLQNAVRSLGHELVESASDESYLAESEVAIVHLGLGEQAVGRAVAELKARGAYVIGHAGHKETELRELGRKLGCDRIASNSEVSFKLEELIRIAQEAAADRR